MTRNLDKRIELMFPIEDPEHKATVLHALRSMFRDTSKARRLGPDGVYTRGRAPQAEPPCRVQQLLHEEAQRRHGASARARRRDVSAGIRLLAAQGSPRLRSSSSLRFTSMQPLAEIHGGSHRVAERDLL